MGDPVEIGRYARNAALAMVATAVLAVGVLISHLAGATTAVVILIILASISGLSAVYMANVARRRAVTRRNELRRQSQNI